MIALYGHKRGESSFVQVTRGMAHAMRVHGALSGDVIGVDLEDVPDAAAATAPISLNCGHPRALALTHQVGQHVERWFLLAPNGERLPVGFAESLVRPTVQCPRGLLDGGLIAPSQWAAGVLAREFGSSREVLVAPHGISSTVHHVYPEIRNAVEIAYGCGEFHAVHMTSTDTERKGTSKLLLAWKRCKQEGLLPQKARLFLIASIEHLSELQWALADTQLGMNDVQVIPGFVATRDRVALNYSRAHVVVQPSRGEGFGMVPLEARCCGVPVVATKATGHSEHIFDDSPGVVVVRTHEDAPMNDFPFSMAPRLEIDDIVTALATAHAEWYGLHEAAQQAAPKLAEQWSWESKTQSAIEALVERGAKHVRNRTERDQ